MLVRRRPTDFTFQLRDGFFHSPIISGIGHRATGVARLRTVLPIGRATVNVRVSDGVAAKNLTMTSDRKLEFLRRLWRQADEHVQRIESQGANETELEAAREAYDTAWKAYTAALASSRRSGHDPDTEGTH